MSRVLTVGLFGLLGFPKHPQLTSVWIVIGCSIQIALIGCAGFLLTRKGCLLGCLDIYHDLCKSRNDSLRFLSCHFLASSVIMITLTMHCQWEDKVMKERTDHSPAFTEAKKFKLAILHHFLLSLDVSYGTNCSATSSYLISLPSIPLLHISIL